MSKLLFYDHGHNLGLASLCAAEGHRVGYYTPPASGYWQSAIGTGLTAKGIEKIQNFFSAIRRADYIFVPGSSRYFDGELVDHLRRHGHRTFGAGESTQTLERNRGFARASQTAAGIPTQKTAILKGVPNLLKFLETSREPQVIKTSQYRDIETFVHEDWPATQEQYVPKLLSAYGTDPSINFIAEEVLKSTTEVGSDDLLTFGRPNGRRAYGYEAKDTCYIGRLDMHDLPSPLARVADAMRPKGDSTFFSCEMRGGYLLDITARTPWPTTAALLLGYQNIVDVMIQSAFNDTDKGRDVPDLRSYARYAGALCLTSVWTTEHSAKVDAGKLGAQLYLCNYYSRDGHDLWVAPSDPTDKLDDTLGYVTATADSLPMLRTLLLHAAEQVKVKDLRYDAASLDNLIDKVIPAGRLEGIEF